MNKDWVLFHLREGLDEVARTIAAIEADPDYDDVSFAVAMAHAYNHLNTAWNARHADPQRTADASPDDFYAWRTFPPDIPMGP